MTEYSVEVTRKLTEHFHEAQLHRPIRVQRYEPGTELTYTLTGVTPAHEAKVRLLVKKFVGGGFAGQVYQVEVLDVQTSQGEIAGLEVGRTLAMKILVPPSSRSRAFRDFLYALGFQGPFQPQVNPAAARAGALWQKFIRRAVKIRFGDENSVTDILATFIDSNLGSCGDLSEWIDGRTWRLEVDDRLDLLRQWRRGQSYDTQQLGSPEYRAKHCFMAAFVRLLHEMGAPEFARQYEWATCKSQPNCLKRTETDSDPAAGLVAVDFRAGLALLPFLPMSPGDFKLIGKGIARGSVVQFDRGSVSQLKRFIDAHRTAFADMHDAFEELKENERIYRDSTPDITHNHIRLFTSPTLWQTIFDRTVKSWQVRNVVDDAAADQLNKSKIMTLLFTLLGIAGALGSLAILAAVFLAIITGLAALVSLVGYQGTWIARTAILAALTLFTGIILSLSSRLLRRLWGRADYRRHYRSIITSWDYLKRAVRARIAEQLILWHHAGRVGAQQALNLMEQPKQFFAHLPLSILPATLHRMLTDRQFAREKLTYIFVRPVRLYFDAELREQWLREMVLQGQQNHTVTEEDAHTILGKIKEPFIQKYLKCLAVHVCTLPVTQIVSVVVAVIDSMAHPELTPAERTIRVAAILAIFQVIPVSPGSICRGLYVVYLVVHERNFKDYNIAVFLSFFKYIGYLAFPIQMAYRYPTLARFMAAHWSTAAAHTIPVFGEKGALLEHGVFSLFYNYPLTLRRWRARRAAHATATVEPQS